MKKTYFLLCSILLSSMAHAATYYVRQGSPGGCTTSNPAACTWANAYPTLPASLERGSTYFIADGTYPSYTFTTPASGSTYIYIKKATQDDHGTINDVTWQASYGDGQAVFGPWDFITGGSGDGGYIDINGFSSVAPGHYGFKVVQTVENIPIVDFDYYADNVPEMKFRYIDFAGPHGPAGSQICLGPSGNYYSYGFYFNGYVTAPNMLISHCAIHGINVPLSTVRGVSNLVVEYCDLYDSIATGDSQNCDHQNIGLLRSDGGTFRYNKIHNYNIEGLYFVDSASDWQIYGNIFYDGVDKARGIEFPGPVKNKPEYYREYSKFKIYQNTFVNLPYPGVRTTGEDGGWYAAITSEFDIRNNLGYNVSHVFNGSMISLENGGTGITTANNLQAASDPFINLSNDDYHLKAHTTPGASLGSPYNIDADGNVRAAWDLGAYEFGGTSPTFVHHPADINPKDQKIDLNEATTFGACWKTNCNANATLDNASRAGYLWKSSATGQYQYNSANACPLCWEVKP